MYVDTTNTDYPSPAEALEPGPPPANKADQPKPKRPPTALKSAARRYENADGRDRSVGESGDSYPGRLFDVPGTNWRVVVCVQGRQWVLQQREGKDRWLGRKFFSNKRRLALVLKTLVPDRAFRAIQHEIEKLPI